MCLVVVQHREFESTQKQEERQEVEFKKMGDAAAKSQRGQFYKFTKAAPLPPQCVLALVLDCPVLLVLRGGPIKPTEPASLNSSALPFPYHKHRHTQKTHRNTPLLSAPTTTHKARMLRGSSKSTTSSRKSSKNSKNKSSKSKRSAITPTAASPDMFLDLPESIHKTVSLPAS